MTCRSTLVMQTGCRDARNAPGLAIAVRGPLWMQKQQLLNGTAGSFITQFGPDIAPNTLRFFGGCRKWVCFLFGAINGPLGYGMLVFLPGPVCPQYHRGGIICPQSPRCCFAVWGGPNKSWGH